MSILGVVNGLFPSDFSICQAYLIHKLMSTKYPQMLPNHNVPFDKLYYFKKSEVKPGYSNNSLFKRKP